MRPTSLTRRQTGVRTVPGAWKEPRNPPSISSAPRDGKPEKAGCRCGVFGGSPATNHIPLPVR